MLRLNLGIHSEDELGCEFSEGMEGSAGEWGISQETIVAQGPRAKLLFFAAFRRGQVPRLRRNNFNFMRLRGSQKIGAQSMEMARAHPAISTVSLNLRRAL